MDLSPSPAMLRPFGQITDLDLDFGDEDRPGLVTRLLAQCGGHPDPTYWWSLPVSLRTAALLRLVAITERVDALPFTAPCSCGETFEFELPLQPLAASAGETGPIQVELDGQRSVTLRRPTGGDLRQWHAAMPASRAEAVRMMLDALLQDGQVQPDDEVRLAELVAEADPLVAFTVSCQCPACGAANEVPIDLDATALTRLRARQRALLIEVHCLASHYGWTESDVLAIPPARRAQYLALIENPS
ncbi:hypothetical protein [Pseudomonas boanensis]|uniref:hypothetical protein n=1 Tax=Metapseudomonas boanensis TaxID=2822138 RepID=UPI0035D46811